jgi:ribosomal protein L37E
MLDAVPIIPHSPHQHLAKQPGRQQNARTLSLIPRCGKELMFVSRNVNKKYCYTCRLPRSADSFPESHVHVSRHLVGDPPALEPLEVLPLAAGTDHTERDRAEQPVQANDDCIQNSKDTPAKLLVHVPRCEVKAETHR